MVTINEEDYLAHFGTPRKSGRYPWGSGGLNADTNNEDFLGFIQQLKGEGMNDSEIFRAMKISSTEYRARKTIARNERKQSQINQAWALKDKGWGPSAIGRHMGIPEPTVRTLLAPGAKEKNDRLSTIADLLREEVDSKKYLDIGVGVENRIGVSQERLRTAVEILKQEGYKVWPVNVPQLGTGKDTRMKVLCTPDVTTQKQAWMNRDKIQQTGQWSEDGGKTKHRLQPPMSLDPKRVGIVYGPDGGSKSDGVMYVREGVEDISLGQSRYAQVRVLVGKDRYLKGMAMYHHDMPDGIDVLFHTDKGHDVSKMDVLKKVEPHAEAENPFGANIARQIVVTGKNGKDKLTSVMNIVNEEGDWSKWGKNVSAQMLSKQSPALAKAQLDMTFENRKGELDSIKALTNPTVRKRLLEAFADGTDASAVHLEAASFPRQSWRAILPITKMRPTEIYAPGFEAGERVALIRYPHGGTFEIPELTVNNRNPQAKRLLRDAKHAVGIHHSVAERLSGADFDGDTVLVIPNGKGRIKASPALEGLKNFKPHEEYKGYDGMEVMSKKRTQQEMGKISNLITDMTIKGAPPEHMVRAVRHSMVVIDAHKHKLNFKESERRNNIAKLKAEYQGRSNAGAATLLSRAGKDVRIDLRKPRTSKLGGPIDVNTGELKYEPSGKTTTNRKGERVPKQEKVKWLAIESDAHALVSTANTQVERIYANHSNRLKAMANAARLEAFNTPGIKQDASAKAAYKTEVDSLTHKLDRAIKNKPLERQAQVVGNTILRAKINANPQMDNDTKKKERYRALAEARVRTGAQKFRVDITDKEWEAIQAGAISNSKLKEILDNADLDRIKELATPPKAKLMTSAKTKRALHMLALGYDRADIAEQLGVSLTTLDVATLG